MEKKTAASSGGLGDIVFAIPVLKKLFVTDIYIKESYYHVPYANMCAAIKRLMESQGFNVHPTDPAYKPGKFDPAIHIDYNLDDTLKQPKRGLNHIIISYLNTFSLPHTGWNLPWLDVSGEKIVAGDYTLIHLTERWRENSKANWKQILSSIEGKVYFTGFQHEWLAFCTQYGNVEWLPTKDVMEMAVLIRDCKTLYCNQSVSLALAQAQGKHYFLERKPNKSNTLMFTANENLL